MSTTEAGREEPTAAASPTRRELAQWAAAGGGCLLAGAAAALGAGFLYPIERRPRKPVFVCLKPELPPGHPREITDPGGRKVMLLRRADDTILAISTICTHLGCAVYYRPKQNHFECPCHQGLFDAEGVPTAGPPRRPLERYPVEVRDGKVFVQFT